MAISHGYDYRGNGRSALRTSDFVRRVYTYFTMGIVAAIGGGLSSLYLSGSTELRSGFEVVAMHEIYAPPEGRDHSFYEIVSKDWATRWPAEELWVAVRP